MTLPTKVRILELCIEPKRYNELKRMLEIRDPALQKHLKDLAYYGYLEKKDDGSYNTTDDGQRLLQIAQSGIDDAGKLDETLFESINKKLRFAKPAMVFGRTSTPLQRLYNAFPIAFSAEKAIVRKDQIPALRKLMLEILSRLDIKIQGIDMNKMSDEHKERILNNMLDSLSVIMSYYKSSELAGSRYQASIALDVMDVREEDRKALASALFWIFKYKPLIS